MVDTEKKIHHLSKQLTAAFIVQTCARTNTDVARTSGINIDAAERTYQNAITNLELIVRQITPFVNQEEENHILQNSNEEAHTLVKGHKNSERGLLTYAMVLLIKENDTKTLNIQQALNTVKKSEPGKYHNAVAECITLAEKIAGAKLPEISGLNAVNIKNMLKVNSHTKHH